MIMDFYKYFKTWIKFIIENVVLIFLIGKKHILIKKFHTKISIKSQTCYNKNSYRLDYLITC